MRQYIIKRLLLLIPTVLGISLVIFVIVHLLPGDAADVLLGTDYDFETARQLRHEWGLDQPLTVQYMKWLSHMLYGDWGRSLYTSKPVFQEVLRRLPVSLQLIAMAICFALLVSVPTGVISAVRPHSWYDYTAMTTALMGISIPPFFLGILLFLLFSLALEWLPVAGYESLTDGLWDNLRHMILPAIALGFSRAALLARLVRTGMLEVIRLEYITTARAKGLGEALVITKHALKNALIPTVTVIGLQIGFMVGGAIIIEKLFAVPGLGSFGIDSITSRDYPQVQGFILISALVFVLCNLLVDILYAFFDPRIKYE
jgi:peptide/nickel transport system permease protein